MSNRQRLDRMRRDEILTYCHSLGFAIPHLGTHFPPSHSQLISLSPIPQTQQYAHPVEFPHAFPPHILVDITTFQIDRYQRSAQSAMAIRRESADWEVYYVWHRR
jgi:hypothetical protein